MTTCCIHVFIWWIQEINAQQADRCTRAQDALLDSGDICGNAFAGFLKGNPDDDGTIFQEILNQICQRTSCKSAVSEYLDACTDIGTVSMYNNNQLYIFVDRNIVAFEFLQLC